MLLQKHSAQTSFLSSTKVFHLETEWTDKTLKRYFGLSICIMLVSTQVHTEAHVHAHVHTEL